MTTKTAAINPRIANLLYIHIMLMGVAKYSQGYLEF